MSLSDMKESMHFWHSTGGPLLYAHRGASRECPENTLPAFERALELGADVIELDVHPTRDGVFVVSHDSTAARVAGVARALADASWAEVSGWDAGAGFVDVRGARPFAGSGVRFARFDEVLARFQNVAVNVDVKDARPRDLERLLSIVREAKAEPRVLLTSFSYRVLSRLRALGYAGAIGLSQLDVVRLVFSPGLFDRLFPYGGVRAQIPTRSGPIDLTAPRVFAKCKRLGIGVDYWVVNEPRAAATLLEHGADGIITDDPRAIAEVFRSSPRTAAWRARHPLP
jgi:glycerophosphoryl diester phosphodiesterase